MLRWLWLSLIVLLADQAIKWWILAEFQPREVLPVTGFFNLVLVFNPGAAFSFLSDAGGWQRWLFLGLAAVVTLVLTVWLARMQRDEQPAALAVALVIGGAVGNLVDRIWHGKVVDFLDFHIAGHHWPAFNIADSAISIGVLLLLLDGLTPLFRRN